jgi:hypothetical protein
MGSIGCVPPDPSRLLLPATAASFRVVGEALLRGFGFLPFVEPRELQARVVGTSFEDLSRPLVFPFSKVLVHEFGPRSKPTGFGT